MIRRCLVMLGIAALAACDDERPIVEATAIFVVPGAGFAPGALYATILNNRDTADTLTAIDMPAAKSVMLHATQRDSGGRESMSMVHHLVVPAHGSVRLSAGQVHGMIDGLEPGHSRGDTLAVTFRFARFSALRTVARVIDFGDVDSLVIHPRR